MDHDETAGTSALVLRPLRRDDEAEATVAHREMSADGFTFLLHWHEDRDWDDYVAALERGVRSDDPGEGLVPATFLVAEVDGVIVGRTSIRHRLDEYLESFGGHIGYGVRPAHRRRGYAGQILRRSLDLARGLVEGDRVLVTCDDGNEASAAVIEHAGGVLEDTRPGPDEGERTRRYWIALR